MTQNSPIAVVCGSTTPVGSALVARMQSGGIAVIAIDLPGVVAHPAAVLSLSGDLTDEQAWGRFINEILRHEFHPARLVYALTETDAPAALRDLTQADWDRVISRNLRGAYLACRYLFPHIGQPGAAVLLASVLGGWDSRADALALSASGGGMLALNQSLALSGAQYQVRVNTVCYDTSLLAWHADEATRHKLLARTPLGRATSPDDIVDAILFLLSDDASYLTGSSLVVDGGQSLQSWSNAPDTSYAVAS